MKYKVIVRTEAEDDLKEAFSWHENKRAGLGYDFLLQVDAGINFINRNPEIHPIEYKGTRKNNIRLIITTMSPLHTVYPPPLLWYLNPGSV